VSHPGFGSFLNNVRIKLVLVVGIKQKDSLFYSSISLKRNCRNAKAENVKSPVLIKIYKLCAFKSLARVTVMNKIL
jgi:hypothetical protein